MALIYADDFQQWATAASADIRQTGGINTVRAASAQDEIQCLGLYPPAASLGVSGDTSRIMTLAYDPSNSALRIFQHHGISLYTPGASGLRRAFSYEGDTLYFGITLELGGTAQRPGDFLFFSDATNPTFTQADGIGPTLYSVGADADGFYTFNGVSTTTLAYQRPASFKACLDCVFGPDYMELWVNNVRIARQSRPNVKIKDFAVSTQNLIGSASGISISVYVHSVIIADNVTPGFAQRVGRRVAKTEQIQTVPVQESAMLPPTGTTALAILRRFANGATDETTGSLVSPNAYVKNECTVKRASSRLKPYAASVHLQAKRLIPSGDGLGLIPYAVIDGVKVSGKVYRPSSHWRQVQSEMLIAPDQTFTDATIGYQHDFKDLNKIYADDRSKVEVYGDAVTDLTVEGPWWKTTDLVAFDSTLFKSAGFNDFTGKQIISTSRVANTLPFVSDESFKYGPGIDMNTSGALLANVAQGAVMTSPWTIDFWFKESAENLLTAWQLYCYQAVGGNYLMICPDNPDTTKMAIWNQLSSVVARATWTVWKSTLAWRHSAVTYDGTKLSFFIDGVLLGSITWTIQSFTKPFGVSHRGFWGYDVTASRMKIERYRMRSGVTWAANFNVENIYK